MVGPTHDDWYSSLDEEEGQVGQPGTLQLRIRAAHAPPKSGVAASALAGSTRFVVTALRSDSSACFLRRTSRTRVSLGEIQSQ